MASVPNSRPRMTQADVLKELSAFPASDEFKVKVLGIRGYYKESMGNPVKNDRGIFDDAMFIVGPDFFATFNANTDPSVFKAGIASLVAPQMVLYKPGIHGISGKNPRPAFRQHSRVKVMRDGNPTPITDTANAPFWINIHDGGFNTTSSEGCQTIYKSQWIMFRDSLNYQLKINKQTIFPYCLIEYK